MTIRRSLILLAALAVVSFEFAAGGIDDASRYTPGTSGVTRWMSNGHRGDIEFGVWSFEAVAESWASAGRFIESSTAGAGDINTGGQSFGIYANPSGSPNPYAAATRKFGKPALTTGDVFSFKIAVNNRSPGNRGFDLRNASGTGVFNFDVHSGGYYVNGDDGASLNASHDPDTVFTFTFTQRERRVDYTIQRTGGITASTSGSFVADSGTIADVRFYISGTSEGTASNFYFNQFSLVTEPRGDAPLTIGERRMPGRVPSYFLRFTDPNPTAVTMRHGGDWNTSYTLAKGGDGVWSLDIRNVNLSPGWHEFKFRLDSVYESGDNRWLYIDSQGRIAEPPAVYLTWQRDPTTTMTVHWHNHDAGQNALRYRVPGAVDWNTLTATTQPFPHTERLIHTAEITGLNPDWVYEFEVDGHDETFRFRTMPATLAGGPLKFIESGDVDVGGMADAMAQAVSAKDPTFIFIGGDHAYENSQASLYWKWLRYLEMFTNRVRGSDGRLIPVVVAVGNHEVLYNYAASHPDFDDSASWRDRYASYYSRSFAFPGPAQPYAVLDFGNYMSLIIGDTEHSSPLITGSDAQSLWMAARLDERRHVPHLFPLYHVTAYPSYRAFDGAGEDASRSRRIRDAWVPLFQNAGVHLVFEHHDHTFKRTKKMLNGSENSDGITFLGDGAWGVTARTPDTSRSYIQAGQTKNHAFLVTISATNRTVEAFDNSGTVFDTITQGIDGIASSPIVPSLANLTTNSASFVWTPVANATNYTILRDGVQIGTTTSTNFTDNQWTPSSGFTYRVVAQNRAGSHTNAAAAPGPRYVWNLTNNLPWDGTGEGAPMADPDEDGRANVAEYFHARNPRVSDGGGDMVVENGGTGGLSVLYRHNPRATDLPWKAVWKSDLAPPGAWSDDGVTDTEEPGSGGLWRRAEVQVGEGESTKFLRLEIGE